MWRHVLPPVVIVIIFWLAVSLSTTLFISYSERTRQRILSENVASAITASDLRANAWKLVAQIDNLSKAPVDFNDRILEWEKRFTRTVEKLRDATASTREFDILQKIEAQIDLVVQSLHVNPPEPSTSSDTPATQSWQDSVRDHVFPLIDLASQLEKHNHELFIQEEVQQKRLLSQIMFARNVGIILGPIVGILVGWRITSRLQRHVSTLAITLRAATSSRVVQVGEVSLQGAEDLSGVQKLSEVVVTQMQQALKDLERAEKEIVQSERLAAVGELAAGIAHELRNPLTSVKLLLQHAITKPSRNMIHVENLDLILREVARMEETIQGLLDFSRPPKMSCTVHDIRIPLQRAVTLVSGRAFSSQVEIECHSENIPYFVNGDIEQLHLVFVNLLINALESIDSGGKIKIETCCLPDSNMTSVRIHDTGCGIPEHIMDRVFEPFVTSKERGTGLGLALCHRVVINHGGTIHASNHPDGGAILEVRLPNSIAIENTGLIA